MKEIKHKDIEEIQDAIIGCAKKWGYEINQGNSKNANKQNSKINKIVLGFKEDTDLSRCVLVPLLQNLEPSVRLFASVHAVDQGIEVQKSLQTLEDLANDHTTRGISIMAYINLKKWKKENKAS